MKMPALSCFALFSATLLAGGFVALLSGCKGNSSAAALVERAVSAPPILQAYPMGAGQPVVDPTTSPLWSNARWFPLVAPANTDRTTAPVSAAVVYDAQHLCVAFISNKPRGNTTTDGVSVYLDSSPAGNGSNMLNINVTAEGHAECSWIRDAQPPTKARDDGTPDLFHPLSRIPDIAIPGLVTRTFASTQNGLQVWSAVIEIPLKSLPLPLRGVPVAGTLWKLNLLRTTLLPDTGSGVEQRQANLSPIFVGSQAVAPYRMATLELVPAQVSLLRADSSHPS